MITIKVNEQEKQFQKTTTLQEALVQLKIALNGIAIAINQDIIPKNDWANTRLNNNDTILIIKATQGG
ncbi:MAG: sulfur carrier protein ThiS [Cellulophaga sp.]